MDRHRACKTLTPQPGLGDLQDWNRHSGYSERVGVSYAAAHGKRSHTGELVTARTSSPFGPRHIPFASVKDHSRVPAPPPRSSTTPSPCVLLHTPFSFVPIHTVTVLLAIPSVIPSDVSPKTQDLSTRSHPRRSLLSVHTDRFRVVPVFSISHCSPFLATLLYSGLCLNPYLSVDKNSYGLLQSMG